MKVPSRLAEGVLAEKTVKKFQFDSAEAARKFRDSMTASNPYWKIKVVGTTAVVQMESVEEALGKVPRPPSMDWRQADAIAQAIIKAVGSGDTGSASAIARKLLPMISQVSDPGGDNRREWFDDIPWTVIEKKISTALHQDLQARSKGIGVVDELYNFWRRYR